MVTFDEFLQTGRLGELVEGQTSVEVRGLLGEPEGVSGRGWPQLWKFGSLQVGFFREARDELSYLTSIALYFRVPEESPPESLGISGWYPPIGCSYDDFRQHLDEVGVPVIGRRDLRAKETPCHWARRACHIRRGHSRQRPAQRDARAETQGSLDLASTGIARLDSIGGALTGRVALGTVLTLGRRTCASGRTRSHAVGEGPSGGTVAPVSRQFPEVS
jgi:hypothetical protein